MRKVSITVGSISLRFWNRLSADPLAGDRDSNLAPRHHHP
jgi:hypothetical protein